MSNFHRTVPSDQVFKEDLFKDKVLFCTGGGSGICYQQVEAMMKRMCFILCDKTHTKACKQMELMLQ